MSEILGWIATVLFIVSYIPQIIKLKKTGKYISIWLLVLSLLGNIVALVYSILISQPPLTIKYIFLITVLAISLFYYDSNKQ